ncbi:Uncharacterised protein [Mycobacteroides abscessus subsp. abscessus]|nr:Uncharacterised protein [Mycobacteroides abscessus subsp. abscessus]
MIVAIVLPYNGCSVSTRKSTRARSPSIATDSTRPTRTPAMRTSSPSRNPVASVNIAE